MKKFEAIVRVMSGKDFDPYGTLVSYPIYAKSLRDAKIKALKRFKDANKRENAKGAHYKVLQVTAKTSKGSSLIKYVSIKWLAVFLLVFLILYYILSRQVSK